MKSRRAKKKKTHIRGIIVWDFDGVLFEIERYRRDNRDGYIRLGVSEKVYADAVGAIRKRDGRYSVERIVREFKKYGIAVSKKTAHAMERDNLENGLYYSPKTDALLHRMRRAGFRQMIVSFGQARYQYKKFFYGCGTSFKRHFALVRVTTRPKYVTLLKIRRQYPQAPLFFVDDTKEHLALARRHVPGITTIHYSNLGKRDLRHVEKTILRYAKKK